MLLDHSTSPGFKMQDKSAIMHHIICCHTELSAKCMSLLLYRPAQLASCDAMATVVAENTKEAWEVKDPLRCVLCACTRVHQGGGAGAERRGSWM